MREVEPIDNGHPNNEQRQHDLDNERSEHDLNRERLRQRHDIHDAELGQV